jgi:hypothetical protein
VKSVTHALADGVYSVLPAELDFGPFVERRCFGGPLDDLTAEFREGVTFFWWAYAGGQFSKQVYKYVLGPDEIYRFEDVAVEK